MRRRNRPNPSGAEQATNPKEGKALLREMTKRKVPFSVAVALQTVIPKLGKGRLTMTYAFDDHARKGPFVHIGVRGRPHQIDRVEHPLKSVGFVRKDSWIDSGLSYDFVRNNPRNPSLVDSWWAR